MYTLEDLWIDSPVMEPLMEQNCRNLLIPIKKFKGGKVNKSHNGQFKVEKVSGLLEFQKLTVTLVSCRPFLLCSCILCKWFSNLLIIVIL